MLRHTIRFTDVLPEDGVLALASCTLPVCAEGAVLVAVVFAAMGVATGAALLGFSSAAAAVAAQKTRTTGTADVKRFMAVTRVSIQ
jgi:hypothetical protein